MSGPLRFRLALDARCTVGESPVWDADAAALLFCDIPNGVIHEWRPGDGAWRSWSFGESVGSFGLCRSGRLVVALRRSVVLFSRHDGLVVPLADVPEPESNRLNDGKVGPDGCFWVGGMDDRPDKHPTGSLYRVTPDGVVERKAEGFTVSNGLAWTADGATMVHSDSRARTIDAYAFDAASGRLGGRRRLATLTDAEGRPDGGAFDREGTYWSAGVSAGVLNRFSTAGALLERHPFPVPAPTMPCFAGDRLYVTSLREGRDPETLERWPALGGIFSARVPGQGVPVGRFADA
ncbi:SMP-30/gluconolactonase/LRE family protein [Lichenibacterium minor]|uniref:SMP-30/gluconolactonase/LRE family protein n=1 Tax=Lichenibacterium minor TaxID=2316528 RepID=A0A4Q2U4I5_9HYPH|nr:SMP-30/gluconolactonase/LRE family protein [Lichenibacterium minor]RYC29827.1 SMP-30/gluconolactonase/LRE family protein [Lichenibacterium minor]